MLSFLFWLLRDALFFFGIVSGRGNFPKPLSPQEEQEALAAMAAGDDTARQKLIEHNLRLVSHIARKYTVPGCTPEDLVSVGTLGLIKAVNTFKPDAGPRLSSYAARCIENAILSSLQHMRTKVPKTGENGIFWMNALTISLKKPAGAPSPCRLGRPGISVPGLFFSFWLRQSQHPITAFSGTMDNSSFSVDR